MRASLWTARPEQWILHYGMTGEMKKPPAYVVGSADHALRLATMLQLEGRLTVAEAADRLAVARSTAHRLLQTLMYRDFAVQDDQRAYHAGPVLQLAEHSRSRTAQLRAVAMPHLDALVARVGESVNLTVRAGATARFIASVESTQALRVTSREGMVFPAHRTSGGLVLLSELSADELARLYESREEVDVERPDLGRLRADLTRIRRQGFALNNGRSERGVVAVGVPLRARDRSAIAGLSVSLPTVRYERDRLPALVSALSGTARSIEADVLHGPGPG